ncbi:hypothetical protein M1M11_26570 [Pseudomonas azerbaijanoccidens]|jgi:hypothetical protein|uniref:hypothetical protein n=1 Tax=Pseudomonas azerbaijanoccidentalis TaxID=2842347 RepID=UPI00200A6C0A|nr:hypothetical protein [Pseudomonas azerbaijanoccidentalis]MCK8668447.1 hypothetical protein [Pseudomonas azerbaijanoccidentalis]
MIRTSLYDRISEKRIAQEEAARIEQSSAPVIEPEPEPEPEPVVALEDTPSSFTFAGFNLAFPTGFHFREIQTTVEHEGEPVSLTIKRRDVQQGQTLDQLFQAAVQAFREEHSDVRIIRQRDVSVAGSAAKSADLHFKSGHADRHARLVGALVPVAGRDTVQWLSIACEIDPARPALSLWLVEFDGMLDGFAVR